MDINCYDEDGDTGLHLALKRYHIKVAEILLDEEDLDLTVRNKCTESALDLVCKKRVFQLLPTLSYLNGIKFHKEKDRSAYEYYALITSIDAGAIEILEYLLDQGFHVNLNEDEDIGKTL